MPSTILSDNGVTSGTAGIKTTGSNDGQLALQTTTAGGTATTALTIDTSQNVGIGTSSASTFGKFAVQTSTSANTPIVAITNSVLSPQLNHYITDSGSTVRNLNQIGFNTGSSSSANYQGFMTFSTMASAGGTISERMRIDSSGNVGIGTSSPSGKFEIFDATSANVFIQGNSSTNLIPARYSTDVNPAGIAFRKYRGTLASPTAVASGDMLGIITFQGYGGTNNRSLSQIIGTVDTYTSDTNISSYLTFATSASGAATPTERMRIDSSGNVGIGTSSQTQRLEVYNSATNSQCYAVIQNNRSRNAGILIKTTNGGFYTGTSIGTDTLCWQVYDETNGERARITSNGQLLVGTTSYDDAIAGSGFGADGFAYHARSGGICLTINRIANDGTLVSFRQDNTEEGNISVSGNTVSYNGFSGGHWTQLPEGRGYNPEILRGTVMSSIGEMCEWKSVVWDEVIEHPPVPAVDAKDAVLDEEGNVIEPAVEAVEGKDAWTETINKREAYLGNLAVGATFEEDGVTKTVVDDGNERLPKVKISDVVGDKAVYGVFQTWDEVQDMLVTSLGAFVVRIAAGVTVQIGDLLESNGDGCAKVQDDDVIRSKTIGKVTSTVKTATYADGSYTVPAVLYCG